MYQIIKNEEYNNLKKNPQVILKSELIELITKECGTSATSIIDIIEKCPTYTTPHITKSIANLQKLISVK